MLMPTPPPSQLDPTYLNAVFRTSPHSWLGPKCCQSCLCASFWYTCVWCSGMKIKSLNKNQLWSQFCLEPRLRVSLGWDWIGLGWRWGWGEEDQLLFVTVLTVLVGLGLGLGWSVVPCGSPKSVQRSGLWRVSVSLCICLHYSPPTALEKCAEKVQTFSDYVLSILLVDALQRYRTSPLLCESYCKKYSALQNTHLTRDTQSCSRKTADSALVRLPVCVNCSQSDQTVYRGACPLVSTPP